MIKRTIHAQISEAQRELRMRREVYGRQVALRKMRKAEADELILLQENIIATLEWCRDNRDLCVEFERSRKELADIAADEERETATVPS